MARVWTQVDREVVRLAVPALGALVAEPVFLLVDTAYVGHLGATPQAALGVGGAILATIVSLAIFLAYGTTGQVARSLGAGNVRGALRAGLDACWLAVALGTVGAVAVLVLAPWLVGLLHPPPQVAGDAIGYLRISALGLPGMLTVLAGFGVLRGLQNTLTPLWVALAGFGANAMLNWVLIYPAGMGLAGAALGTVLAQTGMAAVLARQVVGAARVHDLWLGPAATGVLLAARTGLPLLVRTVAMRATLLVATAVAAGIGTAALAAHQVVFTVWTLGAMGLDAVAIAAQALVGRALGAGDSRWTRRVGSRLVWWGLGSGVVLGLAMWLLRVPTAALTSQDDQVRSLVVAAMAVAALLQPLAGVVFALDGVLIGAGDGVYLAGAATAATAAFVPVALLAGGAADAESALVGLWWAIGAWMLVRGVTLGWRLRSDAWLVLGA